MVGKRSFHRDWNYAILLEQFDIACRIGEMLNLKIEDVRFAERQVVIRVSKSQKPRTLPVSKEWLRSLTLQLAIRKQVMADVPM